MFVIARVLPFFLIMAAGIVAARTKALDAGAARGLSRYVYWIGFPSLLLHALGEAHPPGPEVLRGLLAYMLAAMAPYVAAALLAARAGWSQGVRAALPLASGANNDAFLGLPLVAAVLGPVAAGWAGALVAADWAVLIPFAVAVLHRGARGGSLGGALWGALVNPVTLAALGGVAVMLTGFRWPAPIATTLSMLSASSSPVGLVALGVVIGLSGAVPTRDERLPVGAAVLLRLVAAPAAVFAATTLVGAPPAFIATAVLIAACPTAVTVFIQAQAYDVFGRGAAHVVALSTLASAATLTALAALFATRAP